MVERRKTNRWPLAKSHVKCPWLPATEHDALHEALNFQHVRNQEETLSLQKKPCECSYEIEAKKGMCSVLDA